MATLRRAKAKFNVSDGGLKSGYSTCGVASEEGDREGGDRIDGKEFNGG